MQIQISCKILVNTDPQRRCYNGCHAKSEYQFKPWETLKTLNENITLEEANKQLQFWVDLNDYAVSRRGEGSRNKYRIADSKEFI